MEKAPIGARRLISIPAGTGRTPLGPFIVVTLVGATMWNTFLLWLGMKLRGHWQTVQKYSHQLDYVVVAVILVAAVVFWMKRKQQGKPPGA